MINSILEAEVWNDGTLRWWVIVQQRLGTHLSQQLT
jgi:hypothetical protein